MPNLLTGKPLRESVIDWRENDLENLGFGPGERLVSKWTINPYTEIRKMKCNTYHLTRFVKWYMYQFIVYDEYGEIVYQEDLEYPTDCRTINWFNKEMPETPFVKTSNGSWEKKRWNFESGQPIVVQLKEMLDIIPLESFKGRCIRDTINEFSVAVSQNIKGSFSIEPNAP